LVGDPSNPSADYIDFEGQPFKTVVFDPTDIRPMAFKEIKGAPTQRVVRAACRRSAVKSVR